MQIVICVKPPIVDGGHGSLIFSPSTNDKYSVKKAYAEMVRINGSNPIGIQGVYKQRLRGLWNHIWHKGELLSSTCMVLFLLGKLWCQGYGGGTRCVCCVADEDEILMLFKCAFCRACWFASDLGLKTEGFVTTVKEILMLLMEGTSYLRLKFIPDNRSLSTLNWVSDILMFPGVYFSPIFVTFSNHRGNKTVIDYADSYIMNL